MKRVAVSTAIVTLIFILLVAVFMSLLLTSLGYFKSSTPNNIDTNTLLVNRVKEALRVSQTGTALNIVNTGLVDSQLKGIVSISITDGSLSLTALSSTLPPGANVTIGYVSSGPIGILTGLGNIFWSTAGPTQSAPGFVLVCELNNCGGFSNSPGYIIECVYPNCNG